MRPLRVAGSGFAAALAGFMTRPCCVVPMAMSIMGIGSARLSAVLAAHYLQMRVLSASLLLASIVVNFRRDGGALNKAVSLAAGLIAFVLAAGWLGGS